MKSDEIALTSLWPENAASAPSTQWHKDHNDWVLDAEGMTARVRGSGGHWSAEIILEAAGTYGRADEARGAVLIALSRLFRAATENANSSLSAEF
jgi:hypothetical protein